MNEEDLDIFTNFFHEDLESWFSAAIACCDHCHDEFLSLWPTARAAGFDAIKSPFTRMTSRNFNLVVNASLTLEANADVVAYHRIAVLEAPSSTGPGAAV